MAPRLWRSVFGKADPSRWKDHALELPLLSHWGKAVSSFATEPALRQGGVEWSYRELDALSVDLAERILALPACERAPVGIAAGPGPEAVVGMLASIRCGRAFVVLSTEEPVERLRLLSRLSRLEILLHAGDPDWWAPEAARHLLRIGTRNPAAPKHSAKRCANLDKADAASDLAIVFTSGTEGEPAGVRRTQRSQLHLVRHLTRRCGVGRGDRVAMIIPPSFGACLNDIFLSLLSGATLCPFPLASEGAARLLDWLIREEITYCHCVPSVLRSLSRQDPAITRRLGSLRWFKIGGEPLLHSEVRMLAERFPENTRILYSYGSTETGGTMADRVLEPESSPESATETEGSETIDVGRAIPGKELLILAPDGSPLPPGEAGEIAVRSRYLAAGYYADDPRTRERFAPESADPETVLYRTKDLGKFDLDGRLLHLGRLDGQIKVRGIRVNPGEIEAQLRKHPAIADAAVVPSPEGTEMVAFVAGASPESGAPLQLRDTLARQMPRGMFPNRIVWLGTLPRLANGKIDRGALRRQVAAPASRHEPCSAVAPRDELETAVADIWGRLLGRSGVGAYDDFFELGGDSLIAVNFQADLSRRLGVDLPLALLFGEHPTPAHVAEQVRHGFKAASRSGGELAAKAPALRAFARIRDGGGGRPIVFLPGGYGSEVEMMLFVRLASFFGAEHPICGFLASPLYLLEPSPSSVEEIAARHLEVLRREVSTRAPVLVGHCIAGVVAHEMARQWEPLQGSRERPELVLVEAASRRGWRRSRRNGEDLEKNPSHPEFARFYFDLLDRHSPGLFPGSATLLVSDTYDVPEEPALGWRDHIDGTVKTVRIPGDHHDAIREYREELGRILAEVVVACEAGVEHRHGASREDPSQAQPFP